MKNILIGALLLITVPTLGQTAAAQDKREILNVVEKVRTSILNKDSASFNQYFLHDSIPWIGITDDQSLALVRKYYPGKSQIEKSSYKDFIKFVISSKNKVEEKVANIALVHDSQIASVTFDYSLWLNDKPQNWGKESWQLLKTNGKWKIYFVSYSSHLPQAQPVPSYLK